MQNPEQIMLSAVTRRSSRDVNIMKEKLIFSGAASLQSHLVISGSGGNWAEHLHIPAVS